MAETPTKRDRAGVLLKAAFGILDENGGSLPLNELFAAIETRLPLTEHDRHVFETTGNTRWKALLHWTSVGCVKGGFLRKASGVWHLTDEGRALKSLPSDEIFKRTADAYKAWKIRRDAEKPAAASGETDISEGGEDESGPSIAFETAEAQARAEIVSYIHALGPYEVQDLVAALLRGMGYYTPFVATKGPDGGTDIVAYRDPVGAETPHIRVQVKHKRETKATRDEIASLRGIIRQDREIGLFVSTAGFTIDAVREARHGAAHIEMIDLDRFLELWMRHYDKMAEDDKTMLRLRTVRFLASD